MDTQIPCEHDVIRRDVGAVVVQDEDNGVGARCTDVALEPVQVVTEAVLLHVAVRSSDEGCVPVEVLLPATVDTGTLDDEERAQILAVSADGGDEREGLACLVHRDRCRAKADAGNDLLRHGRVR